MKIKGVTCFLFCHIWAQSIAQSIFGGSFIRLEKFEQCPDKTSENRYYNISINSAGLNKIRLSGFFNVVHPIKKPATLKSVISKCSSKAEPDTCEYYYTYNTDKFCDFIGQENMPWSEFMQSTNMTLACPIKKGLYSINDAALDATKLSSVPVMQGYWKTRNTGRSGGKLWFCADVEISILPKDAKKKRRTKN